MYYSMERKKFAMNFLHTPRIFFGGLAVLPNHMDASELAVVHEMCAIDGGRESWAEPFGFLAVNHTLDGFRCHHVVLHADDTPHHVVIGVAVEVVGFDDVSCLHFVFLFVEHGDIAVDVLRHRKKEFAMNFLRVCRK